MSETVHFYEPGNGHRLPHDPLKAIVGPRPIGWISSRSREGVVNLAPYSFFTMLCDKPPIVGFSSMGWKDSIANVQDTGEFVYNLATRDLAGAMNQSSAPYEPDVDEFAQVGLSTAPCRVVSCPRVAESPASLECRLVEIIRLRSAEGEMAAAWLALGEVVGVHIEQRFLRDGLFDTAGAAIIQRAGYAADYFEVRAEGYFSVRRPRLP